MKEFTHCPRCNTNLQGKDIYQHFFEEYSKNGIPDYARSIEDIKKAIKDYPDLYSNAPKLKELKAMTPVQLAAWDTAQKYDWTKKNPITFKREIGIEIPDYYDGVIIYKCPDCQHKWKRFDWVDDKHLTN